MTKEYISREAALEYIKRHQCNSCSDIGLCGKCAVLIAIKLLEYVPAADVAPVVKCKDCKHWRADIICDDAHYCSVFNWRNNENDFCSCGENVDKTPENEERDG